jgi:hypothetical protein
MQPSPLEDSNTPSSDITDTSAASSINNSVPLETAPLSSATEAPNNYNARPDFVSMEIPFDKSNSVKILLPIDEAESLKAFLLKSVKLAHFSGLG